RSAALGETPSVLGAWAEPRKERGFRAGVGVLGDRGVLAAWRRPGLETARPGDGPAWRRPGLETARPGDGPAWRRPGEPGLIASLLEENDQLIRCIVEYQNKGRAAECTQYQHVLHRNLIYLATIADASPANAPKTVD
uniref:SS18 N-terminal domain-containing protein n=1 Tax=Sarcophilus harrisii TaxID=9305 RepID=A0A7N4PYQ7_SARHA